MKKSNINIQIRHSISGIPFPARRKDVVGYARNKGAGIGVIDHLERLPDQEFKSETDILDHLHLTQNLDT